MVAPSSGFDAKAMGSFRRPHCGLETLGSSRHPPQCRSRLKGELSQSIAMSAPGKHPSRRKRRNSLFGGSGAFILRVLLFACAASPIVSKAQSQTGELRVHVVDSQGFALPARISLTNAAAEVEESLETDAMGNATISHLPYGRYVLDAAHTGFATQRKVVDVGSALPQILRVEMRPWGTDRICAGDGSSDANGRRTGWGREAHRAAADR